MSVGAGDPLERLEALTEHMLPETARAVLEVVGELRAHRDMGPADPIAQLGRATDDAVRRWEEHRRNGWTVDPNAAGGAVQPGDTSVD